MTYARLENNVVVEYPVYPGDIELRYPNTSFTEPFVAPEGYVLVLDTPRPEVDYTKNVNLGTPQDIEGQWQSVWIITDATPDQIAFRTEQKALTVRGERNYRLAACDWTQLNDSPLDSHAKLLWAEYREELRAVPQQSGFPWNVTWPVAPGS